MNLSDWTRRTTFFHGNIHFIESSIRQLRYRTLIRVIFEMFIILLIGISNAISSETRRICIALRSHDGIIVILFIIFVCGWFLLTHLPALGYGTLLVHCNNIASSCYYNNWFVGRLKWKAVFYVTLRAFARYCFMKRRVPNELLQPSSRD